MSIKQRMLETEFPLSGGNPKMRRSSSTKEPPLNQNPIPLNRQTSGSARKMSANSHDPREPLMASEWQYESARSMSRIQTSFDRSGSVSRDQTSFDRSGSVSRDQGVQANLFPTKTAKTNVRSASLNRTASLRKACSDESSEMEDNDDDHERSPLRKSSQTAIERSTTERSPLRKTSPTANDRSAPEQTSSTSDYHSDDLHHHRRTNSLHGGVVVGSTRFSQQPANSVAVESNPVKWQSLR
jgi:hypothetical protein